MLWRGIGNLICKVARPCKFLRSSRDVNFSVSREEGPELWWSTFRPKINERFFRVSRGVAMVQLGTLRKTCTCTIQFYEHACLEIWSDNWKFNGRGYGFCELCRVSNAVKFERKNCPRARNLRVLHKDYNSAINESALYMTRVCTCKFWWRSSWNFGSVHVWQGNNLKKASVFCEGPDPRNAATRFHLTTIEHQPGTHRPFLSCLEEEQQKIGYRTWTEPLWKAEELYDINVLDIYATA